MLKTEYIEFRKWLDNPDNTDLITSLKEEYNQYILKNMQAEQNEFEKKHNNVKLGLFTAAGSGVSSALHLNHQSRHLKQLVQISVTVS